MTPLFTQTASATALIPGSPSAATAVAEICATRATAAEDAALTVSYEKTIDGWEGDAAEAYTTRVTSVQKSWSDISPLLTELADALNSHAHTLTAAQGMAENAVKGLAYARNLRRRENSESPGDAILDTFTPWPLVLSPIAISGPPATSAEAFATAESWLADARSRVVESAARATTAARAAAAALRPTEGSMWAKVGSSLTAPSLAPETALNILASLDGDDLAALLKTRPDLAGVLAKAPPESVAPWWDALSADQQDALVHGAPAVIGNLGGVAYSARDTANRIVLDDAIDRARESPLDKSEQLAALKALRKSSQGNTLVSVVLDEPPLAQVAVGDLDAAKNVSFLVPGMNSNVKGDMAGYVAAAYELQLEQAAATGGDASDNAVIAWLGYHPPTNDDPIQVAHNDRAEVGAITLAKDLTSMSAVHATKDTPASISVVAHSYGTNVAALALTQAQADHVVLLGSAGIADSVKDVGDLNVPEGEVFASQGKKDGWAPIGQFVGGRANPTSDEFGAREFTSEDATTLSGRSLHGIDKHGPLGDGVDKYSYLNANTSSLYNTALATTGRGDDVLEETHSPSTWGDRWLGMGGR